MPFPKASHALGGSWTTDSIQEVFKDAQKLKLTVLQSISAATELQKTIASKEEYGWARNPENLGEVLNKLDALNSEFQKSELAREFLMQPVVSMKKKYSQQRLHTELEEFIKISLVVEDLRATTNRLLKRTMVH